VYRLSGNIRGAVALPWPAVGRVGPVGPVGPVRRIRPRQKRFVVPWFFAIGHRPWGADRVSIYRYLTSASSAVRPAWTNPMVAWFITNLPTDAVCRKLKLVAGYRDVKNMRHWVNRVLVHLLGALVGLAPVLWCPFQVECAGRTVVRTSAKKCCCAGRSAANNCHLPATGPACCCSARSEPQPASQTTSSVPKHSVDGQFWATLGTPRSPDTARSSGALGIVQCGSWLTALLPQTTLQAWLCHWSN
jgi:hypothetical protein